jgi:hypothetical protein
VRTCVCVCVCVRACMCVCVCCDLEISTVRWPSCLCHIHSFHWHVQNATIPCRSQELLPFPSVLYFFLPPFSTNYSSIPFLTSSCYLFLGLPLSLAVTKFIYNTLLGILFSSILCTCPNQRNLFNLIVYYSRFSKTCINFFIG